jgi:hypothetical protein
MKKKPKSIKDLLIEYFILSVFQIPQILSLFINNSLSSHLLFLKLLLFLVFPQLLKTFFLFRVFFYLLFLHQYSLFFLFLHHQQILISLLKNLSLVMLLHSSSNFTLSFPLNLIIHLSSDQFTFQLLFLEVPNHPHFVILMLVLNNLRVFHLLFILLHKFMSKFIIMLSHLLLL